MESNEIILVKENQKGYRECYLLTFSDYMERIVKNVANNFADVTEMVKEIMSTKTDLDTNSEIYFRANVTCYSRFIRNESELRRILFESHNESIVSGDDFYAFREDKCSQAALEKIKFLGMKLDGNSLNIDYQYEELGVSFQAQETLHNLNGNDYLILEVLSASNLLLMQINTGEINVAIGTKLFAKYPKFVESGLEDGLQSPYCQIGISWNNGLYLGNRITQIDYESIRKQYGEPKEVRTLEDFHEQLEKKFTMYSKIIESNLMNELIKQVAQNSMYEAFRTRCEDVFRNNLIEGRYDAEFLGIIETRKERVR